MSLVGAGRTGEAMRESIWSLPYNLGAAPIDAKGTAQDYLTHPSPIPVQIMARIGCFPVGG